ncbi:hypothetical protein F0U62_02385 [Cystobacter fuscus]|nr:hypothetical protein F0U62_02385 [Cystobacter fuscus]
MPCWACPGVARRARGVTRWACWRGAGCSVRSPTRPTRWGARARTDREARTRGTRRSTACG